MPEKKMMVEWDDGADLSQSRKKPGDFSPLTRDSENNLVGQVTLRDVDEDEDASQTDRDPDERTPGLTEEEMLGALFFLGVVVAAASVAAPHVRRWWADRAAPFLKRTRKRFSRPRPAETQVSVAEYLSSPEAVSTASTRQAIAALDEYRASMTSAEARERFAAALVARFFSEQQIRILRDARIEEEGPAWELASAVEAVTPQQLGESITLMLEANPSWPDEETLAELEKILGHSSRDDGEYVQASRGRLTKALRPSRRQE